MSSLLKSSVVLSVLCSVSGKEWTLNTKTSAAIVAGVGAGSDAFASAAAGDNGVGAFVERLTESGWVKRPVQAGLLLDSAVTPSGNTISTSIWTVFLSTDNGATFAAVDGVAGASQSANVWGANKENFALVGNWVVANPDSSVPSSVSGVAVSKDAGATWQVSSAVPDGWVRYGAFPSDSTWYVSSGIWGDSVNDKKVDDSTHHLTSRIHVNKKGYAFPEPKTAAQLHANETQTGWFGSVSKTTDGGATWTSVFSTNLETDYLYFNGISCSSESHCMVVGEGHDAAGAYLTAVYVTFDAGATWATTLTTADVGGMQAKFVNDNEGWVAGTSKNGRNLYGQFYHTTDGGKTFTLEQSLANCYAIDMDFALTTGFAACSSSSGSSASVAEYI